jgi:hypothetical protein
MPAICAPARRASPNATAMIAATIAITTLVFDFIRLLLVAEKND